MCPGIVLDPALASASLPRRLVRPPIKEQAGIDALVPLCSLDLARWPEPSSRRTPALRRSAAAVAGSSSSSFG